MDNRVRITAQLVDGATDEHIWADRYDRELSNVLLLQSEVAGDIAKQIDLELTPQQQFRLKKNAHPVNPEAYQSYLLGRYYWNMRTAKAWPRRDSTSPMQSKKIPISHLPIPDRLTISLTSLCWADPK